MIDAPSLENLFSLKGKNIFIVGSTAGFGLIVAASFAQAGATVTISGRRDASAEAQEIGARFVQFDARDPLDDRNVGECGVPGGGQPRARRKQQPQRCGLASSHDSIVPGFPEEPTEGRRSGSDPWRVVFGANTLAVALQAPETPKGILARWGPSAGCRRYNNVLCGGELRRS